MHIRTCIQMHVYIYIYIHIYTYVSYVCSGGLRGGQGLLAGAPTQRITTWTNMCITDNE